MFTNNSGLILKSKIQKPILLDEKKLKSDLLGSITADYKFSIIFNIKCFGQNLQKSIIIDEISEIIEKGIYQIIIYLKSLIKILQNMKERVYSGWIVMERENYFCFCVSRIETIRNIEKLISNHNTAKEFEFYLDWIPVLAESRLKHGELIKISIEGCLENFEAKILKDLKGKELFESMIILKKIMEAKKLFNIKTNDLKISTRKLKNLKNHIETIQAKEKPAKKIKPVAKVSNEPKSTKKEIKPESSVTKKVSKLETISSKKEANEPKVKRVSLLLSSEEIQNLSKAQIYEKYAQIICNRREIAINTKGSNISRAKKPVTSFRRPFSWKRRTKDFDTWSKNAKQII